MLAWLDDNGTSIAWLVAGSLTVAIVATTIALVTLVRLPPDQLVRPSVPLRRQFREATPGHKALLVGRVAAGWLVIAAGLGMLVLPGPGFLVVLLGVMLAEFPGKHRLQRWMLSRGPILRTANRVRDWFDRPPLRAPGRTAPHAC